MAKKTLKKKKVEEPRLIFRKNWARFNAIVTFRIVPYATFLCFMSQFPMISEALYSFYDL